MSLPLSLHRLLLTVFLITVTLSGCANPQVKVLQAIDGDTLRVFLDGKIEKIRIIGIDTPETKDPRKPVQCYGPEASEQMHHLVDGKLVALEPQPHQDRDKYGRLLRYVSMSGADLGALMISEGFAHSYKPFPHPRMKEYNQLESTARKNGLGLWSACKKK